LNGAGINDCPSCFIDSSYPKGKAFADWLQGNGVTSTYGQIALVDTRDELLQLNPGTTRWIFNGQTTSDPAYKGKYMSFNTPVGAPLDKQCGRAVFSNVHLSGPQSQSFGGNGNPIGVAYEFPKECTGGNLYQDHTKNEQALEFLFFDLSTCVQDDTKPPPPPPLK
jgi:hypothetical protein